MSCSPETQSSLLARVRDPHDERSWNEFSRVYQPLVYRLARRVGLQDADAQEVTQEVLVSVAKSIDRWKPTGGVGSFRAWLRRVARNAAINFVARQRRHPRGSGDTGLHRQLDELPSTASEAEVFDQEYRRLVFRHAAEQIRHEFRDKTWQAFWRTCVDGQTVKQTADQLRMTAGAVYVSRSRIIARLKQEVQKYEEA